MFACETLDEARQFRASKGKASDPILGVKPEGKVHRGDMVIYTLPNRGCNR